MLIVRQLPVKTGWRDAPLTVKNLAELICTIRLHARPSLLSTNFMVARESQMIPFGESNMELRFGSQPLQPLGHETTTLSKSYRLIKSNHNWNTFHLPVAGQDSFLKSYKTITRSNIYF